MRRFKISSRQRRLYLIIFAVIVAALFLVVWQLRTDYERNLQPVSSSVVAQSYFTVEEGESLHQISTSLQNAGLIRSSNAFEWYVRSNELRDNLQAGTYLLSPSMSSQTIAQKISSGQIAKNLVTVLPGNRLDQIESTFKKAGYSSGEISSAFARSTYAGETALQYLPAGKTLEGFLFPDSFQKDPTTPASTIVKESIDEMAQKLTPGIIAGFKDQGLSVYQGITLASIVEQESGQASDDPVIAQVFLSRLASGMPLGSDVTAKYASVRAGQSFNPGIKSPYNTRLVKGLPPGPIGTVSAAALSAVANPAHTDYLYFVTGDNGVTYFSHTEQEHENLIQKYCVKACN